MKGKFKVLFIVIFISMMAATARAEVFYAYLNAAQEVPATASTATGYARINLDESAGTIAYTVVFNGLSSAQNGAHIHAPAAIGSSAAIIINFGTIGGTAGTISGTTSITPTQIGQLRAHLGYVDIHSTNFPNGEIRGQIGGKRPVDFDGDGRTDFSVQRFPTATPPAAASITYYNQNSTGGFQAANWGDANTDFPAPGDYDGDGKDDFAVYRTGANAGDQSVFWILRSSNNSFYAVTWGVRGDTAVNRDYDGDGKTDIAVFHPGAAAGAEAFWYILQSSTNSLRAVQFGTTGTAGESGDVPVPGDYDGDGKFDIAVYRFGITPENTFIVLRSSDNVWSFQPWGDFNTDYILPGDYDGDGKFDYCAARTGASNNSPLIWYILQSSNGQLRADSFGLSSDLPVQGDYDGDARTDIAVYRRGATANAASIFYILRSFDRTFQANAWGLRADFPVATFDAR